MIIFPRTIDCLYLNGSSYRGEISVTASGIPCQSWTEQCPHRHTMNTTYPELNDAKNYCRNPQNSGQRPWCFTTDPNKRWEYCDIPKCTPGMCNYHRNIERYTEQQEAETSFLLGCNPTIFQESTRIEPSKYFCLLYRYVYQKRFTLGKCLL